VKESNPRKVSLPTIAYGLPTYPNEVNDFKKTNELAYKCQLAKISVPNKPRL